MHAQWLPILKSFAFFFIYLVLTMQVVKHILQLKPQKNSPTNWLEVCILTSFTIFFVGFTVPCLQVKKGASYIKCFLSCMLLRAFVSARYAARLYFSCSFLWNRCSHRALCLSIRMVNRKAILILRTQYKHHLYGCFWLQSYDFLTFDLLFSLYAIPTNGHLSRLLTL